MNQTKILLVDDEADVQDVMLDVFEIHGYTNIKAARSGKDALELLSSENFDLVISDFLMPEINGLELFKQAKGAIPKVPKFLMLTGLDSEELENSELEVIQKPFAFRDLLQKVETITA